MYFYHIFYFRFRSVTFPENTVYYSKRTNGKAGYMNEVLDNAKDLEHLHELESRIREGFRQFLDVGNALAEIRMKRLYKLEDFKSFAEYVKAKFNYNLAYCNYVINTAEMIKRLEAVQDDSFALPTSEAQCKALQPLLKKEVSEEKVEQVKQVLAKIKEEDVRPTAKAIQATIAELYPDALPPEKDPTEFNERVFGNSLNKICSQMRNINEEDIRNFFADHSRAEQKSMFISEIRKLLTILES